MSAPSYFVDHRRGEVNELKALLRNPRIDKDLKKKTEVMKKVIAFQTQGIDVSRCFSEMVMAGGATKNPILKKIVYHYLCTYAQQRSDLAILAINTLRKDCSNEDPMVRGLALRSLCSLRLPNLEEYVQEPIRHGLKDPSPYVRKTAVMGITKLFRLVPQFVKDSDFIDILYSMLRDQDTQVITNVICTLNEVLVSEGKMAINSKIVLYLLNRLHEFSEWGQCSVLELVARYQPSGDDEMFDIMNLLETRLQHANSAVVMGACTAFLNLTQSHPQIYAQVFERIKSPLLTLMGGGPELGFALLSHIKVLVQTPNLDSEGVDQRTAAKVFADAHKHFYIGFNDPSSVKSLKLDILTRIADERTGSDIVSEVAEYITDMDTSIACKAIESLGILALRLGNVVDETIAQFLSFLKLGTPYVTAQTLVVMKDLLRKYSERCEEVLPMLENSLVSYITTSALVSGGGGVLGGAAAGGGGGELSSSSSSSAAGGGGDGWLAELEANSRAAIVWMLGEFGEFLDEAPYLLELFVQQFEEESSREVRLELLTAGMRLFFKRPPEMQKILGNLLQKAIRDTSRVEIRDKALLYYRLLETDVQAAARIVNSPQPPLQEFLEWKDENIRDLRTRIFSEFNTLSVVFGQTEETFTQLLKGDITEEDEPELEPAAEQELLDMDREQEEEEQQQGGEEDFMFGGGDAEAAAGVEEGVAGLSLGEEEGATAAGDFGLDLNDFLGASAEASAGQQTGEDEQGLQLRDDPICSPQEFQGKWAQLGTAVVLELQGVNARTVEAVNTRLSGLNLKTMASGSVGGTIKFYVYGQTPPSVGEDFVFVECIVAESNGQLRATIKTENAALGEPLKQRLQKAFSQ